MLNNKEFTGTNLVPSSGGIESAEHTLVVESGETPSGKEVVAKTSCEITFKNNEDLSNCVEAIKESDEKMKLRPPAEVLYGWDNTYKNGMKIHFGVLWYDFEFFERRKDAYKTILHASLFAKFNVSDEAFEVEHQVL